MTKRVNWSKSLLPADDKPNRKGCPVEGKFHLA